MIFILKFLNSLVLQVLMLFSTHLRFTTLPSLQSGTACKIIYPLTSSLCLHHEISSLLLQFVTCSPVDLMPCDIFLMIFVLNPCVLSRVLGLSWVVGFCALLRTASKQVFSKLSHLNYLHSVLAIDLLIVEFLLDTTFLYSVTVLFCLVFSMFSLTWSVLYLSHWPGLSQNSLHLSLLLKHWNIIKPCPTMSFQSLPWGSSVPLPNGLLFPSFLSTVYDCGMKF